MQPQQKSQTNNDIGELTRNEAELIRLIRVKYRFGRLTVVIHDGQPKRIEETVRYESLEMA
jgi:hypothetical protein